MGETLQPQENKQSKIEILEFGASETHVRIKNNEDIWAYVNPDAGLGAVYGYYSGGRLRGFVEEDDVYDVYINVHNDNQLSPDFIGGNYQRFEDAAAVLERAAEDQDRAA
ncbi:MAG: hypothetical protein U5K77_01665 [Candidatus Saccharibacteria bacterium]|nr:hypothetical protein [Candidatus Saccharibacteria bacterium]